MFYWHISDPSLTNKAMMVSNKDIAIPLQEFLWIL